MAKVSSWSPPEWKSQLKKRLDYSRKYRELFEPQWKENLGTIQNPRSQMADQFNITFDTVIELESGEVDAGDSEVGMNYAFKYLRFWHSQMSANPPSVVPRPRSSDPSDRRKADAADRITRYLSKVKDIPETVDQMNHQALTYGTAYTKVVWDPDKGEVFDFNDETAELTLNGDHLIYSPNTDDVWMDPDARRKADVRYMIERITLPLDEALFRWPEHADALKRAMTPGHESELRELTVPHAGAEGRSLVEVYEYYEKGAPINGMAGRHAFFLFDGTPLKMGKNPHFKARLPYKILTYLDVPGQVYGKSVVEYVSRLQDMLNRLDSSVIDTIQAHGVVRMAIHENTEIEDEAVSNSSWDWIKYSGDIPPHFIGAPSLMQDIWRYREQLVQAIQDLFGVNDSMMGIQRREQSAVSQQTSIESGTMVHRRLFKKYARCVEELYEDCLGLVRDHWKEERQVLVLGKEKAFEAADFSGADIAGGFDLDVEYGASLPLDPNLAREQLMLLMPALKEAGMTMRQILRRFRLSELDSLLDRNEMAADRQREIFEEMIASLAEGEPQYITPQELQEHQGMLEYCYDYVMTSEYKYLPDDAKALIDRHIKEREQMAAEQATPEAAAPTPTALPGSPDASGAVAPAVAAAPPPPPGLV